MNKLSYGIFVLLLVNIIDAQPAMPVTINALDQEHNGIMRDLRLIRKCYFGTSKKCSAKEQAEAYVALKGLGKKIGAIITIIGAIKLLHVGYRKARTHGPAGKSTPASRAAQDRVFQKSGAMAAGEGAQAGRSSTQPQEDERLTFLKTMLPKKATVKLMEGGKVVEIQMPKGMPFVEEKYLQILLKRMYLTYSQSPEIEQFKVLQWENNAWSVGYIELTE